MHLSPSRSPLKLQRSSCGIARLARPIGGCTNTDEAFVPASETTVDAAGREVEKGWRYVIISRHSISDGFCPATVHESFRSEELRLFIGADAAHEPGHARGPPSSHTPSPPTIGTRLYRRRRSLTLLNPGDALQTPAANNPHGGYAQRPPAKQCPEEVHHSNLEC